MHRVTQDEFVARANLRLAGVLTELRNEWIKRLDSYYCELERLISGEWLDGSDLAGLVNEARLASREAMDGLATDLTAELMHSSTGILQRHQAERAALEEEIGDLRTRMARLMMGNENTIRQENESLREAILTLPEFKLLEDLQLMKEASYQELSKTAGIKPAVVRKRVKLLVERGYARVDKTTKPHTVCFMSAPWSRSVCTSHSIMQSTCSPVMRIEPNQS